MAQAQEMEGITEITSGNETPPTEKCEPNLTEACSNQDDCKSCYNYDAFCLWCPLDTVMRIQTDPDPYYARLTNVSTFTNKTGGEQGYCGYGHSTKCIGNWNGDEYYIDYYFLRDRNCVGSQCVGPEEKLPLVKFLTKDVLDNWKKELLKNISEEYFEEHFDIESIHGYVSIDQNGNHKFEARIYYLFKYDWVTTSNAGQGGSWDLFTIAEKKNDIWQKLIEDEISSYYQQELERWHNLDKIKVTEYEIKSVIPRNETISKLKECHGDMEIDSVTIGSENKTLFLMVGGNVAINTERCEISHENTYTIVLGGVNLITGDSICTSHEAPCALYAPGEKSGITDGVPGISNVIIYFIIGIFVIIILFVLFKRRYK